ncbi:hypothetical protein [Micromonospora sp. WMMD1274]|uniref:hypothetical protein n=1 Tax=Micromonospora sp. WMMD1274 TaxID=3404116 RepID=UPI003B941BEB
MTVTRSQLMDRLRDALDLPADAADAVVLAAIDVANARSARRLGLSADTPPAQIRAAERQVAAAAPQVAASSQPAEPAVPPELPRARNSHAMSAALYGDDWATYEGA